MEMSRAEDPVRGTLRDLLSSWGDVIGVGYGQRITLKEVITLIGKSRSGTRNGIPIETLEWPDLNAAVRAAIGMRQQPDVKSLGNWMRGNKNRVVNDMWFNHAADPKGGSQWWVEHKDGSDKPGKVTEF